LRPRIGTVGRLRASMKGHVVLVVDLLVVHGAAIEAKDNRGNTPLHIASLNDHPDIVKALLSGGANILAVNNAGRPPIHKTMRGEEQTEKWLSIYFSSCTQQPVVSLSTKLVEDLTWIGDPYNRDVPPLRFALHEDVLGTDDVVATLLRARDQDGSLPLHLARRRGASFPIVQSLVDIYKASVKSLTPQGDLPLFLACEMPEPSLDTIYILVQLCPDFFYP
jgi:hypothetical protein